MGPGSSRAAELQVLWNCAPGSHEVRDPRLRVGNRSMVSVLKYLAPCLKTLPKLLRDLKII